MFNLKSIKNVGYSDSRFASAADKLTEWLNIFVKVDATAVYSIGEIEFTLSDLPCEAFKLTVTDEKITVEASDPRGAVYGASALIQSADQNADIAPCVLTDKPDKPFRGVHIYLPSKNEIEEYKRILDVVAFLKLNTVIIEVGGAMEYERHPEINTTWKRFCKLTVDEYPETLQWSTIYWKDSIHPENGGGSYLTKAEVRGIVEHAKSLGLDVIPEIQALSHAYYLTLAHREIAEYADDPFPDTFCPLNEKSYELYFDVADEVIEVFEPKVVSIGHDEVRVLGMCDKCKGHEGHELFAYEVTRLHEFYKSRNIRIMMWAEKYQEMVDYNGDIHGGQPIDKITSYAFRGFHYVLPATFKAIDMVPKDIIMLDWYWSLNFTSTDCFLDRDFTVAFGNFGGGMMKNYNSRINGKTVIGAECSTWVLANDHTYAGDGIFFNFSLSALMLWNTDYEPSMYAEYCDKVNVISDYIKAIVRRRTTNLTHNSKINVLLAPESSDDVFDLAGASCAKSYVKDALKVLGDKVYGLPIDRNLFIVKEKFKADSILLLHNAAKEMKYIPSYNFPSEKDVGIGTYAVIYEDGAMELINASFGRVIGARDMKPELLDVTHDLGNEIDTDSVSSGKGEAPDYDRPSKWLPCLYHETTPLYDGDTALYAFEWHNPYPEKNIIMFKAINASRDVEQVVSLYAVLTVNN